MGKRKTKNQEKKKKIALVFDESQRKDFLCGFRKRKLERKKKAQEEIQRLLKEEKKRIKQENKESYKKLVVSSRPLPDIEQLLKEEYEDVDVNVKIVELSSDTLQKKDLVIGENRPQEKIEKKSIKIPKESSVESVPGMGSDTEVESAEEEEGDDKDKDDKKPKSKKELKHMLMQQAKKKMQKSKVFQMKSKLDRIQNKKKSHLKKEHMARTKAKSGKPGKPRKEKSKKNFGRRKH
ncbi:nucleolar protein 12 [Cydia pomonella]|uniref:nucleolar protein 12 n=1 Tax=Cydia pomonella TaxID=82600 RepID=UPI002ADD8A06|nr:nucleolar protein 12 [Cydia pomonella]